MDRRIPALCSFVVLAIAASLLPAQAPAASDPATSASAEIPDTREASQVRIVRLSLIAEKVELDRNTGRGFEPTLVNLPVVQGNRLRTQRGWAEVEFEDNSTLRVTPETLVDFPTLGRTAAGDTINTVRLTRGTLYLSLVKSKDTDFTLDVGDRTVTLPSGSHIRVDVYPAGSEIYVFEGRVTVAGPSGSQLIQKAHALRFNVPGRSEPVIARDDQPGLYDEWDRTAVKYHGFNSGGTATGTAPYAYGSQDLASYGQFSSFGDCGQAWIPYFSNAAFDPFANGAWAWYPGSGYTFVSAYPWGWLPYHSGNWANCGGRWAWQPTGQWHGLKNHPVTHPIRGPVGFRPLQPPSDKQPAGKTTFVLLGTLHGTPSEVKGNKFVFSKDSAGIGVPRDSFGNLARISSQLDRKGSVERTVQPNSTFAEPMNTRSPASSGAHATAPSTSVSTMQSRPVAGSGGSGSGSSSNTALWIASGGTTTSSTVHSGAPAAAPASSGGGPSAASGSGGSHH